MGIQLKEVMAEMPLYNSVLVLPDASEQADIWCGCLLLTEDDGLGDHLGNRAIADRHRLPASD